MKKYQSFFIWFFRWGGFNEYPQFMFWAEMWKISDFFIWNLSVYENDIFNIFEQACFRNV